jgi:hypothetical protein
MMQSAKADKGKHLGTPGSEWPHDKHVPTKTQTSPGRHYDLDLHECSRASTHTLGGAWMAHIYTACGKYSM